MVMHRLLLRLRPRRLAANSRRNWLSDRPLTPELLAAEQAINRMQRALEGVGGRTRAIFLLHRLDGMDYAQIAQHMNLTVIAVEKHVANALTVLAEANERG
jgi:RNA polymerase sigma factor (sigma-70 family)